MTAATPNVTTPSENTVPTMVWTPVDRYGNPAFRLRVPFPKGKQRPDCQGWDEGWEAYLIAEPMVTIGGVPVEGYAKITWDTLFEGPNGSNMPVEQGSTVVHVDRVAWALDKGRLVVVEGIMRHHDHETRGGLSQETRDLLRSLPLPDQDPNPADDHTSSPTP